MVEARTIIDTIELTIDKDKTITTTIFDYGTIITTVTAGAVKSWITDGSVYYELTSSAAGGGSDGLAFYIPGNSYVANGIVRLNIPKAQTVSTISFAKDSEDFSSTVSFFLIKESNSFFLSGA